MYFHFDNISLIGSSIYSDWPTRNEQIARHYQTNIWIRLLLNHMWYKYKASSNSQCCVWMGFLIAAQNMSEIIAQRKKKGKGKTTPLQA